MPKDTPGRPQSVTDIEVYTYLQAVEEPVTVSEIAERFDVSEPTARDRVKEVVDTWDNARQKKVGKAAMYWADPGGNLSIYEDLTPERFDIEVMRWIAQRRGEWLHARDSVINRTEEEEEQDLYFYIKTAEYVSSVSSAMAFHEISSSGPPDEELSDLPERTYSDVAERFHISEEDLRYYMEEATFLEHSFLGEVNGLGEWDELEQEIRKELQNENFSIDSEDVSPETIEEVIPTISQTLLAGETFDSLVSEAMDFRW